MAAATSIPTGTVSFLFTDIEGSTRLAQQYPDAWANLLSRHNAILDRSVQEHQGYVFQIVGDSFCAAFHSVGEAVSAAVEAQRLLDGEAWTPAPVKVRMGIHTGKADYQGEIYEGYVTLSHTQRLMSAAHGGQVLISLAAQELIRDELPLGVTLRDLGERRLKDVVRVEHIYQLVIPHLPSDFPPIKALELHRHNLPAQITSFIGREPDMAEVLRLLTEFRLITLTGSGGAGKTRLAIEVAARTSDQFIDGAWLVELAPVSSAALISQTLLSLFNLREDSRRSPLDILIDHLREKSMLLVLDNCEHLIEASARIAETLLHACPQLRILTTSRQALGIAGEAPFRVPSLSTPDPAHMPPLDELGKVDSIRLFLERAVVARPGFHLEETNAFYVADICAKLDGIPLAIELAASRLKVLSPEQIATRLDDRFRLLTGGSRTALPRQQTLQATIDWSYSLLSEDEKALFRRLAVFVGGWTFHAAEVICGEGNGRLDILDLLTRLLDKSIIFTEESEGEIRYHRLETIRQYSRDRLFETAEADAMRDRHLDFFMEFAELVDSQLKGADQMIWQRRTAVEMDNLRAALEWGLARNPDAALRIAGDLNLFWTAGGYSAEGFRWTQQALDRVENAALPEGVTESERLSARAAALRGLTRLYLSLGDNVSAKRSAEKSVALFRQGGDRRGLAFALVILGYPLEFLGERAQAEAALQESYTIARDEQDMYVMCRSLNRLARVVLDLHHDVNLSRAHIEESIRLARSAGLRSQEAQAIEMSGHIAAQRGYYDEARSHYQESMKVYEEIGAPFNAILEKSNLAHLERRLGQYARAGEYYRETIVAFRDVGQSGAVAHQLECFGFIALAQNAGERALRLFAAAHHLRDQSATPMTPEEQKYFDKQLDSIRKKMDVKTFATAWSEAEGMTMAQAIELALDSL